MPLARARSKKNSDTDKRAYWCALLEAQFETAIDGILIVGANGKILAKNEQFGRLWHIPKVLLATNDDKKLLNYVFRQLFDPKEFIRKVKYLYIHRKETSFDQLLFKDGKIFDRYSAPIFDRKNKYLGRIWFFRDATEKITAQKQAATNEIKFQSLFNVAADAIYILDTKGRFIEANKPAWERLGYTRSQLLKLGAKDINSPASRPTTAKKIALVTTLGSAVFETEHITRSGKVIPVEICARTFFYNDRPAIVAVCRDLSERKQLYALQNQAIVEKQNFKTIFDNAGDAIFILPGENVYKEKFIEVNKTACEKLGYTRDELLHLTPRDLEMRPATTDFDKIIDQRVERMKKRGILFFQLEMRAKNGRVIPFELISRRTSYSDHDVIVSVARDLTDIRTIRELEETRALQDDFLNIATHELRTPLSSIIGLSEIINRENNNLSPQERHYIDIIHNEGERLAHTIKQILAVTRFENKGIVVNKTTFKLNELLTGLEPILKTITHYRNVTIVTKFETAEQTVMTDRERISQVIYDLTDNAAKFGPAGQTITLAVSRPNNKEVMISVTDQGPGVPKNKQEDIFKKFGQLDTSFSRSQEGIGLGLYTAKMTIETLGGKIGVISEPGHGATFWFTIPTP